MGLHNRRWGAAVGILLTTGLVWGSLLTQPTPAVARSPGPASASGATGVTGPAGTTSPTDSLQVVFNVPTPRAVFEDNPTSLTGRLPTGLPDKFIVFRKLVAGQWKVFGSTRTGANGAFGYQLKPVLPGPFVLQAIHTTGDGQMHASVTRTVDVLDRRVYMRSHPSYTTFQSIVMTGSTYPAGPAKQIVIQRFIAGRWVDLRSGHTNADGRFAIAMPNNLPGRWTVRSYWPGIHPGLGTAEATPPHTYLVNAVLHPVVTPVTLAQLGDSYHAGCPVGPALLRNVQLTHKSFAPIVGRGTLVVRSTIVNPVISSWGRLLTDRFPIRKIVPAADYGGSDIAMMYDDDTSAFNCRHVTGDPTTLSPHSYGIALDVNTVENPYMDVHGTWWPKTIGIRYRNRSHVWPGMLFDWSHLTTGLKSRGFQWGGDWYHPDYQHFDTFRTAALKTTTPEPNAPAARSAGPLSATQLPAAEDLGAGWRRYADPGGPESGWIGNGTFVHARDGHDAGRGVLPLGCAHRPSATLPMPSYALQGTYHSPTGRPAQAVVMQFRSTATASTYFAGLEQTLRGCGHPDGPTGVAVTPRQATATTFVGVRRYGGDGEWSEVDVRSGARVVVLLSSTRPVDPQRLVSQLQQTAALTTSR